MAYITKEEYKTIFGGCDIPDTEFKRLASIASDVIDSIVTVKIDTAADYMDKVQKVTAYEVEMLYEQGGVDAVTGMASGSAISSESLGGYSVSANASVASKTTTKGGIPISELTISLLKNAGLMSRWAYYERYKKDGRI